MALVTVSLFAVSAAGIQFPVEAKSAVAFIYVERPTDSGAEKPAGTTGTQVVPNGTGFFVSIPVPNQPNKFIVYFVTAKHVIKQKDGTFYKNIYLRTNRTNGKAEIEPLPVIAPDGTLLPAVASDESVDLAVFPIRLDMTVYDLKFVPEEWITTKEEYAKLNIREGTDVFFTGMFAGYIGSAKNYPIVRFGRVALVTDEKIGWRDLNDVRGVSIPTDLYLIETGSYGGNSGSPVFFSLGFDRKPGTIDLTTPFVVRLAGIMQGAFLDGYPVKEIETAKVPFAYTNVGIAAVVPAYKLHEILYSEKLVQQRGF